MLREAPLQFFTINGGMGRECESFVHARTGDMVFKETRQIVSFLKKCRPPWPYIELFCAEQKVKK